MVRVRRSLPLRELLLLLPSLFLTVAAMGASPLSITMNCDFLLRHGLICDGSGQPPFVGDVAVTGDRIVAVGNLSTVQARHTIDATGMVVAPGFINMLSWATESLLKDGRSQSDLRQGVTLEIMGEGESMGPLNPEMKKNLVAQQGDIRYQVEWTTLGEYLEHLVKRGVSCNVASFVGATTLRTHEIGYADRPPTRAELARMQALARQAMQEGALGLASSLIYAPGYYAKTAELIALASVVSEYGGIYISHLRSEGNAFLEGLDELITIAREAKLPAEIYHLKAAGEANWPKLDAALQRIEHARAEGLRITANMYTYTAGATGLDAAMPPWVQEGGYQAWAARLKDPAIRARVRTEMLRPTQDWESLYLAAGSPDRIRFAGFKNPRLKPLTGKTLAEVARQRGTSPEDTAMDLVIEDGSRVSTIYFMMSEENLRKQMRQHWVSFGSDAPSLAPKGAFLKTSPHPRAYGNFSRLLGTYVREEKILTLQEAIRRLTSLPAENLKLEGRGALKPGYFADLVVFDPATITDRATFDRPHQYATGVSHVWVNGVPVLRHGRHTGAKPGRVVRGPGWQRVPTPETGR